MGSRHYRYVGPEEIRQRAALSERVCVRNEADILRWIAQMEPVVSRRAYVVATYIVDPEEQLWIADRRSEHVACARGSDVLAAGEIVLSEHRGSVEVVEATNQSTGYCPEPACWSVLQTILDRLAIPHPPEFTQSFEFRRCAQCRTTNLIKDDVFECAVCRASLSGTWNYES